MAFWLLKADPDEYGFDALQRDRRTVWDGVANPQAIGHMRAARCGDLVLVYHTASEKAVVGVAEIVSDPVPDPQAERGVVFTLQARRRLPSPVTLAAIRAAPAFRDFPLVRQPRLSVMPVPAPLWNRLMRMAGETV